MKRILTLALAITALTLIPETSAQAQGCLGGYDVGVGMFAARHGGFYGYQQDQAPYFARHPPVYYSHVVKRAYGISPYPAPSGVLPVEMTIAPKKPIAILNPYFEDETPDLHAPDDSGVAPEPEPSILEKTTWIQNPYVTTIARR